MPLKCEAGKAPAHDGTPDVHGDHESESESDSAAVVAMPAVQRHSKRGLSGSSL